MGSRTDADRTSDEAGETVLPLLAEEVAVTKRVVETGRVQVARVTHEREELIDELLSRETAEVERVRIGQPVDTMPAVREAGDTVVIPIVEEVLLVERRLFLKEEVRVRPRRYARLGSSPGQRGRSRYGYFGHPPADRRA